MTMLMYTAHLQREDALLLRVVYQTAQDVTYRVKLKLREGAKNHRKECLLMTWCYRIP